MIVWPFVWCWSLARLLALASLMVANRDGGLNSHPRRFLQRPPLFGFHLFDGAPVHGCGYGIANGFEQVFHFCFYSLIG
jgi:hypothetical protein